MMPAKPGMNFLDTAYIYNCRAMYAHEFHRVKLVPDAGECLANLILLTAHVQPCVIAVGLDPIDRRTAHKDDAPVFIDWQMLRITVLPGDLTEGGNDASQRIPV